MCQFNVLCFDFPAVFLLASWKCSKEENEPHVISWNLLLQFNFLLFLSLENFKIFILAGRRLDITMNVKIKHLIK